jgi:hypothetical protein
MMALAPGWTATYQKMPPLTTIDVPQKAEMRIFLPEQDSPLGKTTLNVLPCVNPYTRKESFIELYNVGKRSRGMPKLLIPGSNSADRTELLSCKNGLLYL